MVIFTALVEWLCALQTAVEVVRTTELGMTGHRVAVAMVAFNVVSVELLPLDQVSRFGSVFTGVTLVYLNEKWVDEAESAVGLATIELRWGANSEPGALVGGC